MFGMSLPEAAPKAPPAEPLPTAGKEPDQLLPNESAPTPPALLK